jgi:hypothetical protein
MSKIHRQMNILLVVVGQLQKLALIMDNQVFTDLVRELETAAEVLAEELAKKGLY